MLILVANLGSTSFKFKVLDMDKNGEVVAWGSAERLVGEHARTSMGLEILNAQIEMDGMPATHSSVIEALNYAFSSHKLEIDAIGFKAVHGGPISGAVKVDAHVLDTMQQFADIAPAHNPPYIAAMKAFAAKLPGVPQVACFETAFHQTIPLSRQVYGIPWDWTEKLGIRRYGFHGASHRYIATRAKELIPSARKIVSCHLGGSSSITAIEDGKSVATSMGLTPQTGLLQNNRVGDFDTFALQKLLKQGLGVDDVLKKLGKEGGLLGISGVSNDMRDIEKAAAEGNERAKLAIDAFAEGIRHYLGAYLVALGGIDALIFTGGIGENGVAFREQVCANLGFAGVKLDAEKNKSRAKEAKINSDDSSAQIWIIPTNEELIVARQTKEVLRGS